MGKSSESAVNPRQDEPVVRCLVLRVCCAWYSGDRRSAAICVASGVNMREPVALQRRKQ